MTTNQKVTISVARVLLLQIAQNLADAPARARAEASKDPGPLGTSPFEAGWLKGSCDGGSQEIRAVLELLEQAFPNAMKEAA